MMENRYILLLLHLVCCCVCSAQVTAVVFDMETRREVADVTVFVNPKGSVKTDIYGRFCITEKCYGVTLSHGGYESLSLNVSEIGDTLWLMPKTRRLDEVVIIGRKPKLGFSLKDAMSQSSVGLGNNGGFGFNFFSLFDFKGNKQAKRRKKIKEILDKY